MRGKMRWDEMKEILGDLGSFWRSVTPDDDAKYYYFTIDDQLVYLSFFQDWGPLNLAMVYKACILIHELLQVRC